MQSSKVLHVISCHAEGEVGDVIVGGYPPPPGDTLWEQARYLAKDNSLRNFVLNEPRGGVFRHVNLLVPAKNPKAQMGFIIMEPCDTPPMSGSNSICVATVLLDSGIVEMQEPGTNMVLEAPGGLVSVKAECHNGRVEKVTVQNLASFVYKMDCMLELDGIGSVRVDTGFGGDSFVMVDARDLGVSLVPNEARELAELGVKIADAATEQIGFQHPEKPDWRHYSFCQFAGPLQPLKQQGHFSMLNAVAIRPAKLDRCPTGTGVSARMALLKAQGKMQVGDCLHMRSMIGGEFVGEIIAETMLENQLAIVPQISGRAWITGVHQHMLDPRDPWPEGYRVSDTWPVLK